MLNSRTLIEKLKNTPEAVQFQETIGVIEEEFHFIPTAFQNGEQKNEANENNGSCKILSFAKHLNLTKEETLYLFGDFYRVDVLKNPQGKDHQNIRQFMIYGWQGVSFSSQALSVKTEEMS